MSRGCGAHGPAAQLAVFNQNKANSPAGAAGQEQRPEPQTGQWEAPRASMSSKDGDKDAAKPAAAAEPADEVRAAAAGAEEDEDASPEAVSLRRHRLPLRQRPCWSPAAVLFHAPSARPVGLRARRRATCT